MGFASTIASFAGFFVPVTVGKLTNEGVSIVINKTMELYHINLLIFYGILWASKIIDNCLTKIVVT